MNDRSPSSLELLHFARRVVVQQATAALAQLDRWIADEERREAERLRGLGRRPPPAEWLIERGLNPKNIVAVHTGDCWGLGDRCRPVSRSQALEALEHGVPACRLCRPDTALGYEG